MSCRRRATSRVIFVLLPLIILTGLTMSPGMDAAWPWLVDLFGGRQSARSIHFIVAWLLVAFFVVHILMVLLAGPLNEIRSMITGWYVLPNAKRPGAQAMSFIICTAAASSPASPPSAATLLAGCDKLASNEDFKKALFSAENMHKWLQRCADGPQALAREFRPEQRSPPVPRQWHGQSQ